MLLKILINFFCQTGGLFGQQSQAAKPVFGGFGSTTTAAQQSSPFSFNAQPATAPAATTSIFGSSTASPLSANKPFGATGFGSGTTSTGFGAAATTTPTSGGIFGSTAAKPAFGATTTTTTSGFGGFGATTATTQPAAGGIFGGFGSTSTTAAQPATASPFGSSLTGGTTTGSTFGQTQQTGGIFGSSTAQAQPASTTGGIFGNQTSGGFGSGLSTGFGGASTNTSTLGGLGSSTTGGIFGASNTAAQPASQFNFGGASTAGGSSFLGQSTLGGGLTSGTLGQTSVLGGLNTSQQQQQQQEPMLKQQLSALANSPYGSSYHLSKKDEIYNPVSPLAQRQYIAEATSPGKLTSILSSGISEIKGGLSQPIKLSTKPLGTISLNKVSLIVN